MMSSPCGGNIRDKEELGVIVANQSNKISKLEGERMEYQKKIIEAEREKRDFHEKLEQERQAAIQALKKLEKQKRDLERLQQEAAAIARHTWPPISVLALSLLKSDLLRLTTPTFPRWYLRYFLLLQTTVPA
jgi:vacuolar-type H+-ATPase subunit I/STV1